MNRDFAVYSPGYVIVQGDSIVDVGPGRPMKDSRNEIAEWAEGILMPGFVNTHHHLAEALLRGISRDVNNTISWSENREHTNLQLAQGEEETYDGVMLAVAELIHSGVTTTVDSQAAWANKRKSDGALRAANDSGLRVVHSVAFVDRTEMVPKAFQFPPEEAAHEVERLAATYSSRLVEVVPEALSLPRASDELIRALHANDARLFAMHLTYIEEFAEWSLREFGRRPIEHLDDLGVLDDSFLGAHPIHLTSKEMDLFAARQAAAAYCAVDNLLLACDPVPLLELLKRGVRIGLGIDYPNHSNNMLETIKFSILVQKQAHRDATAINPEDGLQLATMGGARALGIDGLTGSLEAGKQADLIVLDGAHRSLSPPMGQLALIAYSAVPESVSDVMVAGEWIMKDRLINRFDEQEVLARARSSQARVLGSTNIPAGPVIPDAWTSVDAS